MTLTIATHACRRSALLAATAAVSCIAPPAPAPVTPTPASLLSVESVDRLPDPTPPAGETKSPGALLLRVDGRGIRTQNSYVEPGRELARVLSDSTATDVQVDVLEGASWKALVATVAAAARHRVTVQAGDQVLELPASDPETRPSPRLFVTIGADALELRTWRPDGAARPAMHLPSGQNALPAQLLHECGTIGCGNALMSAAPTLPAREVIQKLITFRRSWPSQWNQDLRLAATIDDPDWQIKGPGRLPAELVQDAIRRFFRDIAICYQSGLSRNSRLVGSVRPRLSIDSLGKVAAVNDAGSDLPDDAVIRCVFDVFKGVRFLAPEGGTVQLVYPVQLNPD